MIKQIRFKESCDVIEETWLAPYAGYEAFIIDDTYLILNGDVSEFDTERYKEIYDIMQVWD